MRVMLSNAGIELGIQSCDMPHNYLQNQCQPEVQALAALKLANHNRRLTDCDRHSDRGTPSLSA